MLHAIFPPSIVLLRAIAVVCGLLALLVNYRLCRRVFGWPTAIASTLVLASLPEAIAQGRFGWDPAQSLLADAFVLYLSLLIVKEPTHSRKWTAKLSWHFLAPVGPTIPKFPAEWIDIVFHHVDYFEVSPRDPEMPVYEDITFDTVSFIEASENSQDYLHNALIPCFDPALNYNNEPYHILFRLHGGQIIRIGAARAEFVLG